MAHKTPVQVVKDQFGDKAKLIEAVQKFTGDDLWVARTNKDKGLAHVSNTKLLRLHRIFSEVQKQFGTRAKLIDAILEIEKRSKDDGYKSALGKHPVPRLFDLYRSHAKRAKNASEKAAKKTERKAEPKKAAAPAKKAAAPAKKAAAPAKKAAPAKAKKKG